MFSNWPVGHAVHVVATPEHVWQLLLQARQADPDWYVPLGQAARQLVLLSSGVAEAAAQVTQPVAPVHVPHVAWHAAHAVPFE